MTKAANKATEKYQYTCQLILVCLPSTKTRVYEQVKAASDIELGIYIFIFILCCLI